jgi:hypothetical protein
LYNPQTNTMNTQEIRLAIRAKLAEAGIEEYNDHYDDSNSLVSVLADRRWVGGSECLIGIREGYVQKWQRDTPYNYTRGFPVGGKVLYNTPDEMIAAVKSLKEAEVASCWK